MAFYVTGYSAPAPASRVRRSPDGDYGAGSRGKAAGNDLDGLTPAEASKVIRKLFRAKKGYLLLREPNRDSWETVD